MQHRAIAHQRCSEVRGASEKSFSRDGKTRDTPPLCKQETTEDHPSAATGGCQISPSAMTAGPADFEISFLSRLTGRDRRPPPPPAGFSRSGGLFPHWALVGHSSAGRNSISLSGQVPPCLGKRARLSLSLFKLFPRGSKIRFLFRCFVHPFSRGSAFLARIRCDLLCRARCR